MSVSFTFQLLKMNNIVNGDESTVNEDIALLIGMILAGDGTTSYEMSTMSLPDIDSLIEELATELDYRTDHPAPPTIAPIMIEYLTYPEQPVYTELVITPPSPSYSPVGSPAPPSYSPVGSPAPPNTPIASSVGTSDHEYDTDTDSGEYEYDTDSDEVHDLIGLDQLINGWEATVHETGNFSEFQLSVDAFERQRALTPPPPVSLEYEIPTDDEDTVDGACAVCRTRTPRVYFVECQHLSMCKTCFKRQQKASGISDLTKNVCPVCRTVTEVKIGKLS